MEDTATTRAIWGRTFELLACERCSRPIMTKAHAATMAAAADLAVSSGDLCDVCKKRVVSERLAAPGERRARRTRAQRRRRRPYRRSAVRRGRVPAPGAGRPRTAGRTRSARRASSSGMKRRYRPVGKHRQRQPRPRPQQQRHPRAGEEDEVGVDGVTHVREDTGGQQPPLAVGSAHLANDEAARERTPLASRIQPRRQPAAVARRCAGPARTPPPPRAPGSSATVMITMPRARPPEA